MASSKDNIQYRQNSEQSNVTNLSTSDGIHYFLITFFNMFTQTNKLIIQ